MVQPESSKLDSSLKRHTALIKRIRQSVALENRDQILKDIDTLSLEKYVDEIAGAVVEGIARCKTEKDVWAAVEVRSHYLSLSGEELIEIQTGHLLVASSVSDHIHGGPSIISVRCALCTLASLVVCFSA